MPKVFATISGQKFEPSVSKEFDTMKYEGRDCLIVELTEGQMRLIPYDAATLIRFQNVPPLLGTALSAIDAITIEREAAPLE